MTVSLNSISPHVSSHGIVSQNTPVDQLNSTPSNEVLIPSKSRTSALDKFQTVQKTSNQDDVTGAQEDEKNRAIADQKKSAQDVEQIIQQLKARDLEVKTHEQAHLSAGGQYVTSGANYVYQTGPDGNRYAIGGEVGIDTSPIAGNPEATLLKAQQIQAAAMAPAKPSSQDYSVARAAMQMANNARIELARSGDETQSVNEGDETQNSKEDVKNAIAPEDTNSAKIIDKNETTSLISSERQQFDLRMATR
ncbi:MAG: hypothetical protein HUJ13_02740 [Hydrogenovibrio crunogenus]|uniref:SprA-related family protein n=1 Tax=Hydrogenovibrio crunogenus (strain DSM 25203 / XCL-2) TaxID=317025 RepID=Q31EP8_HYDCU|nr:hypothetical protein [Hydrogenovibrio crunogenus]